MLRGLGDELLVGRQAPRRAVETDDRPERRESAADGVQMLEITRADEHQLDSAGAQHVLELGALRTVVEWDEDGAEHRRGVVGLDVTVGIGVENRHARARPNAEARERAREAPHARQRLGVREPAPLGHHRLLVGDDLGRDREEAERVHRRRF